MQVNFVLTLTGPDRIGIVEEVTRLLLDRGGNVETGRMARLGGEFAVLVLVSMPAEKFPGLEFDFDPLASRGYKVTLGRTSSSYAEGHEGWLPYVIEVEGADHEGIIHEVSRYLSELGISIESMESECTPAPTSGVPLFAMSAQVVVPPALSGRSWEAGLDEIGSRMNLDVRVSPGQPARLP